MAIKNKELPVLKIGKHQPKYPIIQGGMGNHGLWSRSSRRRSRPKAESAR